MNAHDRKIDSGEDTATCSTISDLFARIGDKWTIQTIRALGREPKRFNELRRAVGDISQKMMSTTLRRLERDGFVSRMVTPTTPPQVEYALTEFGQELSQPLCVIANWAINNAPRIYASREQYDAKNKPVRAAGRIGSRAA